MIDPSKNENPPLRAIMLQSKASTPLLFPPPPFNGVGSRWNREGQLISKIGDRGTRRKLSGDSRSSRGVSNQNSFFRRQCGCGGVLKSVDGSWRFSSCLLGLRFKKWNHPRVPLRAGISGTLLSGKIFGIGRSLGGDL